MIKKLTILICLTISICNCNNHDTVNIVSNKEKVLTNCNDNIEPLKGSWISHTKSGFSLLEIKDSLEVMFYVFNDAMKELNSKVDDRFFYFNSSAKIVHYDTSYLSIQTSKYRLDFKISKDTLIELMKDGLGEKFIKVYTVEEKAYKYFNSIDIKGLVAYVSNEEQKNIFVTQKDHSSKSRILDPNNRDFDYSFSELENTFPDYELFISLATKGDSVFKKANSDTLILFNKKSNKKHKLLFRIK